MSVTSLLLVLSVFSVLLYCRLPAQYWASHLDEHRYLTSRYNKQELMPVACELAPAAQGPAPSLKAWQGCSAFHGRSGRTEHQLLPGEAALRLRDKTQVKLKPSKEKVSCGRALRCRCKRGIYDPSRRSVVVFSAQFCCLQPAPLALPCPPLPCLALPFPSLRACFCCSVLRPVFPPWPSPLTTRVRADHFLSPAHFLVYLILK